MFTLAEYSTIPTIPFAQCAFPFVNDAVKRYDSLVKSRSIQPCVWEMFRCLYTDVEEEEHRSARPLHRHTTTSGAVHTFPVVRLLPPVITRCRPSQDNGKEDRNPSKGRLLWRGTRITQLTTMARTTTALLALAAIAGVAIAADDSNIGSRHAVDLKKVRRTTKNGRDKVCFCHNVRAGQFAYFFCLINDSAAHVCISKRSVRWPNLLWLDYP